MYLNSLKSIGATLTHTADTTYQICILNNTTTRLRIQSHQSRPKSSRICSGMLLSNNCHDGFPHYLCTVSRAMISLKTLSIASHSGSGTLTNAAKSGSISGASISASNAQPS